MHRTAALGVAVRVVGGLFLAAGYGSTLGALRVPMLAYTDLVVFKLR